MSNPINKVLLALWTIYTAFTSFISPVWLTMIFLNLSEKIYQLDYTYDEGTSGIVGMILLFVWLIFVLTPNILYLLTMKAYGIKYLWIGLGLMAGAAIICLTRSLCSMLFHQNYPIVNKLGIFRKFAPSASGK